MDTTRENRGSTRQRMTSTITTGLMLADSRQFLRGLGPLVAPPDEARRLRGHAARPPGHHPAIDAGGKAAGLIATS
jgi:hypothetical protein